MHGCMGLFLLENIRMAARERSYSRIGRFPIARLGHDGTACGDCLVVQWRCWRIGRVWVIEGSFGQVGGRLAGLGQAVRSHGPGRSGNAGGKAPSGAEWGMRVAHE